MKVINLTKGQFTIVDDEDYDELNQWKWHVTKQGYAARSQHKGCKTILMHRWILKPSDEEVTDHINGNKLDNRKTNLRAADKILNARNRYKANKTNKAKMLGVYLYKRTGRWRASIMVNKKDVHLGYFASAIDAKNARHQYIIENKLEGFNE